MRSTTSDQNLITPSPTQTEDDTRRIAQAIDGAGMSGPARVALDALKPLHWIAGQFAWALQPFLGSFGPLSRKGSTSIESMARLLEREGGVTELTGHLDTLMEEKQAAKAKEERGR